MAEQNTWDKDYRAAMDSLDMEMAQAEPGSMRFALTALARAYLGEYLADDGIREGLEAACGELGYAAGSREAVELLRGAALEHAQADIDLTVDDFMERALNVDVLTVGVGLDKANYYKDRSTGRELQAGLQLPPFTSSRFVNESTMRLERESGRSKAWEIPSTREGVNVLVFPEGAEAPDSPNLDNPCVYAREAATGKVMASAALSSVIRDMVHKGEEGTAARVTEWISKESVPELTQCAYAMLPGYAQAKDGLGLDDAQLFPTGKERPFIEVGAEQLKGIMDMVDRGELDWLAGSDARYVADGYGEQYGTRRFGCVRFADPELVGNYSYDSYNSLSVAEAWLNQEAYDDDCLVVDDMLGRGMEALGTIGRVRVSETLDEVQQCGTFYDLERQVLVECYTGDHDSPTVELSHLGRDELVRSVDRGVADSCELTEKEPMLSIPYDGGAHGNDIAALTGYIASQEELGAIVECSDLAHAVEALRETDYWEKDGLGETVGQENPSLLTQSSELDKANQGTRETRRDDVGIDIGR